MNPSPRRLATLLEALGRAALGLAIILSWAYLLSTLGAACPVLDGGLVYKAVALPLGREGAWLWALLLLAGTLPLKSWRRWLGLTALPALLATLRLGNPLPLAAATAAVAVVEAYADLGGLTCSLASGVILVEAAHVTYVLGRAYCLDASWASIAAPLHLALYCPAAWAAPVIVVAACLSPILALRPGHNPGKLKAPLLDWRLQLAAGLFLSLLIWALVYASPLNPEGRLVGVDPVVRYYPHAQTLLREGVRGVLRVGYDRPLHYLYLLALSRLAGPLMAVKLLLLTCLLAYTTSTFLLARELWGPRVAGLAALLAPLSYTTTTGLYGGLYSNWTSLSLTILAYTALIKWLRRRGARWLAAYLLLLLAAAATHVYMGAVAYAATTLTLIIEAARRRRPRLLMPVALQLALAIACLHAADTLITRARGRPPSTIILQNIRIWLRSWPALSRVLGPRWWDKVSFAVYRYAATAALDPLDWLLTLTAIASLGLWSPGGATLTTWLAAAAALALTAPTNLIYRALYDFPYAIAEAYGLTSLARRVSVKTGTSKLVITALLLFKLSYTLNYVAGLTA